MINQAWTHFYVINCLMRVGCIEFTNTSIVIHFYVQLCIGKPQLDEAGKARLFCLQPYALYNGAGIKCSMV